jgi:hypothetical protein
MAPAHTRALLLLLLLRWPLDARRKHWTLLRDDSIFVDWQRLKVQENVEEVRSSGGGRCGAVCGPLAARAASAGGGAAATAVAFSARGP